VRTNGDFRHPGLPALRTLIHSLRARQWGRAEERKPVMRKAIIAAALAAALITGGAQAASAQQPEQEVFTLDCDGQTLEVAVSGQGLFTPGRVTGTTQVLVPITFDISFRAVLPDGEVIEESFLDEKGGGAVAARNPRPTVTCTFEESFVLEEDDPEIGLPAGTEVTFGGEVTGFLTGR
jgi:hypothetical protein